MAQERGNGDGHDSDLVLKALHEVVAEVHGVATELRGTNSRLDRVESVLTTRLERVEGVLLETRQEQRETNARLGKVEAGVAELRVGLDGVSRGLDGVREDLDGVREDLEGVRGGLADLRGEVHEGFADLGQKIESAADRDRHLEQSVQQLGERVARLEARSPEPR
jgi:chromosome segregation ATPase